ncbi:hypothetical protein SG34_014610 [Thalassomonas viridans]|uniref:Uncharacterized protein n=1 Tax=Thalassomonas viridans TaxID=137584 RepID=A0AAF0CCD0_9GAMM|nr:hypothetical protein [Thalassomonas viridans]WDE08011.1 hypothetical protein SG34_014610 [Thalassomonas viridans]
MFEVDEAKKVSYIFWDIPQDEGLLGDARNINLQGQSDWYMVFAVSGYPYFMDRGRGPVSFQISASSEERPPFYPYAPALDKLDIVY